MIKNRVADLTEDQLQLVLEGEERKKDRGFVGVTLGKFIEENHLKDATLTRLYERDRNDSKAGRSWKGGDSKRNPHIPTP